MNKVCNKNINNYSSRLINNIRTFKPAFTLAEMMVIMLLMSIVMAASMPLITKRTHTIGQMWRYMANSNSIYYGDQTNQLAAVGIHYVTMIPKPKLYVNSSSDNVYNPQIGFGTAGSDKGIVSLVGTSAVLGNPTMTGATPNYGTVGDTLLGSRTQSTGQYSTAIGYGANAVGYNNSTAIGTNATAISNSQIRLGVGGVNKTTVSIPGSLSVGGTLTLNNLNVNGTLTVGGKSEFKNDMTQNNTSGTTKLKAISGDSLSVSGGAGSQNVTTTGVSPYFSNTLRGTTNTNGKTTYSLSASSFSTTNLTSSSSASLNGPVYAVPQGWNASSGRRTGQSSNGYLYKQNALFHTPYRETLSDKRLKVIQAPFKLGLEKLRQLNVVEYKFDNAKLRAAKMSEEHTKHIGVTAQNLQVVFPDAVEKGQGGYLHIRMEDMFYAMMQAIQELDKQVQNLSNKFDEIALKVNSLEDDFLVLLNADKNTTERLDAITARYKELEAQDAYFNARVDALEK